MKFKLCFVLTLSLIILFSVGGVVASENTTLDTDYQTIGPSIDVQNENTNPVAEPYILGIPSENANSTSGSDVLAVSMREEFKYNRISYDFGGIKYESNAYLSDYGYVGKAVFTDSIFSWTITLNTTNDTIVSDPDLPAPRSKYVILIMDNETDNSDLDSYYLMINGLKLPEGLEYMEHYADVGTYDVGNGTWDIGKMPENCSVSLTVISKVTAKPGEFIPGFFIEYQKSFAYGGEATGLNIWENKLVLSNNTDSSNDTDEIKDNLPYTYVEYNESYFEIIKYNESYPGALNITGEIDTFYMLIDENGTITYYLSYVPHISLYIYDKNFTLLEKTNWVDVVVESDNVWRENRDYKYRIGDYSNYRKVESPSQDTNSQSKSEDKSIVSPAVNSIVAPDVNSVVAPVVDLAVSAGSNVVPADFSLGDLTSPAGEIKQSDARNSTANSSNSNSSTVNVDKSIVNPIYIVIFIIMLLGLVYVLKRKN